MKRIIFILTAIIIIFSTIHANALATGYMVTGDMVNLRSTPQVIPNNVLTQLHLGDEVIILEETKDWYFVIVNDTVGYIHSNYVGFDTVGIPAMVTSSVNFRSGPDTSFHSYGTIPRHTIVRVLDNTSNSKWYEIEYEGMIGYVFSEYLFVRDFPDEELLGCYTTFFSRSPKGRVANINKSAQLLNEYVVAPFETFSILSVIGPITKEGGYYEAPEYVSGPFGTQTVTGYGGGVCQLATTLYQSVESSKLAGCRLEILERHHHSKSVSYIADGRDATISWNSGLDFVFQNNNSYAIKIRTYVQNGSVSCMIFKCI